MSYHPEFTLTPQPYTYDGVRMEFQCLECGHREMFVRLPFADRAHVMGHDHYRGECPEVRYAPAAFDDHPTIVEQRARWARDHRTLEGRLGPVAARMR